MLKRIAFGLSLTALLGCSDKGRYQFTPTNADGLIGSGVLLDSATGRLWPVLITPKKIQISEPVEPAVR